MAWFGCFLYQCFVAIATGVGALLRQGAEKKIFNWLASLSNKTKQLSTATC